MKQDNFKDDNIIRIDPITENLPPAPKEKSGIGRGTKDLEDRFRSQFLISEEHGEAISRLEETVEEAVKLLELQTQYIKDLREQVIDIDDRIRLSGID
jgi:hypothetical protein